MKTIKYGIIGASGKMGIEIQNVFSEAGHESVFKFDLGGELKDGKPELLIDFSLPAALDSTVHYAETFKVPVIIGTTGLVGHQIKKIKLLSRNIPVVFSQNFSVGIQLLLKCIEAIKDDIKEWDIELEEIHHRFKKDQPSGTAIMIKETIDDNIPISSLRLGNIPGIHTVMFGSLGEILKIEHNVQSRRAFAEGVLKSASFIIKKKNGFYSFRDVINNKPD